MYANVQTSLIAQCTSAEVRVYEKLERNRLTQLKQIQAMQQQKKHVEDAFLLVEQTRLEQEEICQEFGSDYESDDEDAADRKYVTQPSRIP